MAELHITGIHMLPLEWGGQGCSGPGVGGSLQEATGRADRTQGKELGGVGPVWALSFLQHDLGSALASRPQEETEITLKAPETSHNCEAAMRCTHTCKHHLLGICHREAPPFPLWFPGWV